MQPQQNECVYINYDFKPGIKGEVIYLALQENAKLNHLIRVPGALE